MAEENPSPVKSTEVLSEPTGKASGLSAFMEGVERYLAQGQYDAAIAMSRQYLDRHPDALAARLLLGRCFVEKDMTAEAKVELEKVVDGIEECLYVYRLLSQVYLKEKNVDKALEALRKALFFSSAEEPSFKRITPLEMGLFAKSSSPPFVTPPLQEEKAATQEPSTAPPPRKTPIQTDTLAEIYIKQGHLHKALSIYQEILARDPENPAWQEKVKTLKRKLEGKAKMQGRQKILARLQLWLRAVETKAAGGST